MPIDDRVGEDDGLSLRRKKERCNRSRSRRGYYFQPLKQSKESCCESAYCYLRDVYPHKKISTEFNLLTQIYPSIKCCIIAIHLRKIRANIEHKIPKNLNKINSSMDNYYPRVFFNLKWFIKEFNGTTKKFLELQQM